MSFHLNSGNKHTVHGDDAVRELMHKCTFLDPQYHGVFVKDDIAMCDIKT